VEEKGERISCSTHGDAYATYICEHLHANSVQRWHGALPSADNPWPDSWCDQCNEAYLREGEWNDANSEAVRLKILCEHCYERAKGRSVHRLQGPRRAAWRSFVDACQQELGVKQGRLQKDFALGKHKRWDWDQDRAKLVLSNDGIAAVVASIAFAGSLSSKTDTWLWSWANPNLVSFVQGRMTEVRDFGETEDYPHLVVPKWTADETDGREMAAVATHILGTDGAYKTDSDFGFLYMVLSNVRFAQ
jgi:hypothetical protein